MKTQTVLTSQSSLWHELLNRPVLRTGDMGFAPSTMITWESKSLIHSQRKETKDDWRKYSALDYIWMQVLDQFRIMGASLPLIIGMKQGLFDPLSIGKNGDTLLEKLTIEGLIQQHRVFIYLFRDGNWMPFAEGHTAYDQTLLKARMNQPFTAINLSEIIEEFLSGEKALPFLSKLKKLSSDETEIVNAVQAGSYQYLKVQLIDGKSKKFILQKEVRRKLLELITNCQFQSIELLLTDGKLINLRNHNDNL